MIVSIIVAVGNNNVIGKDNKLIWHLPADLKYFKSLTMGHHIIMGRKTFESIGKALPGRTSIIVSRQPTYKIPGCIVVHSLEEAVNVANNDPEIFIIGGAEIFKESLHLVNRIYLTRIYEDFEGDTFFDIDLSNWKLIFKEDHISDEKNPYNHSFCTYEKKK